MSDNPPLAVRIRRNQSHEDTITTENKIPEEKLKEAYAFMEHEKQRRRNYYLRQCERKKLAATESVADRTKRTKAAKKAIPTCDNIDETFFHHIGEEINRLVKLSIADRNVQFEKQFRWVLDLKTKTHYLQFQLPGKSIFTDIAYIGKSTIPRAGYGLFAAIDIPKNQPILIYMGREVKSPAKNREYIMTMPATWVCKHNGESRWESVRKGRKCK